MKLHLSTTSVLLTLLTSTVTADLLTQGNGALPQCGSSCKTLTAAANQCGSSWSCFCSKVWKLSGHDTTNMCTSACPGASEQSQVSSWYTANCGSDNGASEHSGSSGGTGTGSDVAGSSSAAVPTASTTKTGAEAATYSGTSCTGSWWHCHWQWIVMVIVLALGLIALGVGGRLLKNRYDRKRDQRGLGFNAGITSRHTDDKAAGADVNNSSLTVPTLGAGEGRDSPTRSRDAFMPYGYGYSRSESRMEESPVPRGSTPVNEVEKGDAPAEGGIGGATKKLRRVLVRERSLK